MALKWRRMPCEFGQMPDEADQQLEDAESGESMGYIDLREDGWHWMAHGGLPEPRSGVCGVRADAKAAVRAALKTGGGK